MVYYVDPLSDRRWESLIARRGDSAVFHTRPWLQSLGRTYGYEPAAITTSAPGEELQNAILFCRLRSWLTGQRIVSLPFSDHCQPLVDSASDLRVLIGALEAEAQDTASRYVEMRPLAAPAESFSSQYSSHSYCLHLLPLSSGATRIFESLHKDCIRRKIRRAVTEGLSYEEGNNRGLLAQFYRLQVLTRRRQGLLPQPLSWFQNLSADMRDSLTIRIAARAGVPVAGIITLRHKTVMTYKYGCSDARFHRLGGMQLLLWKAIEEAATRGFETFDFGRSDWTDAGLIQFKDRWGADRRDLSYIRLFPNQQRGGFRRPYNSGWQYRAAKAVFTHLPGRVAATAGELVYRHIG